MSNRRPQKANKRRAECHPERPHYGRGLCAACYKQWLYRTNPAWRQKRLDTERARQPQDWAKHIKKEYGLTPADYEKLLRIQGYGCAACGAPPELGRHLAVDHDHTSHQVRGLLCKCCNMAIGFMRNNPFTALAAWRYLRHHHGLGHADR
jgi:hypothetical protein